MSKVIQLHIYRADNGEVEVNVVNNEVWLTQKTMAQLFGVTIQKISSYVNHVIEEDELDDSVIKEILITTDDGKNYTVKHYNLSVILPVGYRVNSKEASRFRNWANKVITDYLTKGVAVNQYRLDNLDSETLERVASSSIQHFVTTFRNLGFDDAKIRARLNSIVARHDVTDALRDRVQGDVNYAEFTDRTYLGLFSRRTKQLEAQNGGLKARDGMTAEGLHFLATAESSTARLINGREYLRYFEALTILDRVCSKLKPSIESLEELLGVDLGTSQPLLDSGGDVA